MTLNSKKTINRLKLLKSFLLKQTNTHAFPIELGIEIINTCNLRCIMCPYNEMVLKKTRPQTTMTSKTFTKIINEASGLVEIVYLHGLGESLLHPKLFKFIKYAKSKNVPVGLSTNAMLLNKKKAQQLLTSGLDYLILAFDGATKKTYESIRKNANFESVKSNIEYFLQLKTKNKAKKPFTVIQFILQERNKTEQKKFLQMWAHKGADILRIKPVISLKDNQKNKTLNSNKKHHSHLLKYKNKFKYCYHIFRQLNIYSDGTVVPCCEDVHGRYVLGNVKTQSLKQLFNCPKMQTLRKINFKGNRQKITICSTCTYPQPNKIAAALSFIPNHLTLKKFLPYLEKYL